MLSSTSASLFCFLLWSSIAVIFCLSFFFGFNIDWNGSSLFRNAAAKFPFPPPPAFFWLSLEMDSSWPSLLSCWHGFLYFLFAAFVFLSFSVWRCNYFPFIISSRGPKGSSCRERVVEDISLRMEWCSQFARIFCCNQPLRTHKKATYSIKKVGFKK